MQDPCDSQQASSHAPVGDDPLCRAWLLAEGHRTDAGFLRVFPTRKDGGGEASTLPAQEPGVLGGGGGIPIGRKDGELFLAFCGGRRSPCPQCSQGLRGYRAASRERNALRAK